MKPNRTDLFVVLSAAGLLALGTTTTPSANPKPDDPPILREGKADPVPIYSIPDYCAPMSHRVGMTFHECSYWQEAAGVAITVEWPTYPTWIRIACSGEADSYTGLLHCFRRAGFRESDGP
jgi:hypothetical protein